MLGQVALIAVLVTGLLSQGDARAQEGVVIEDVRMGSLGDHWADLMRHVMLSRTSRDKVYGYEVTYRVPGHGRVTLFWPRDQIDLPGKKRRWRTWGRVKMRIRTGYLHYPDRITARSLPEVHAKILEIEDEIARVADSVIAPMEMIGVVAGVGAAGPVPRAPATAARAPAVSRAPAASRTSNAGARSASFGRHSVGAAQAPVTLSGKARRLLGNLARLKDLTVREAIRSRGGTAHVVKEAGDEFAGQFVGHVANAAADGNLRARKVIKLIKDAKRLGQRY